MNASIVTLLGSLKRLPSDWHGAGLLPFRVLEAIAACAPEGGFRCSLETGSGASSVLLSNLSARHHVFAMEGDNRSISSVRESSLTRRESLEVHEGPTQRTLPAWTEECVLDFVLLDGPHALPFHHLEYYYVYPRLRRGSWLLLDNIEIPTINDHYRCLKADAMYDLVRRVGNTAFFQRTDHPMIDPFSDSWWLQGYNRRKRLVDWTPEGLAHHFLPVGAKRWLKRMFRGQPPK